MTDILAILDAAISTIGQNRSPKSPLFPSEATPAGGTGTPKYLANNGIPALPVVPAKNRVTHDGNERTAENESGSPHDHNEIAPQEYTFKSTGTTGSTGTPQDFCGSEGSRTVVVDGNNGNTTAGSGAVTALEQAGIAYLSEHALFIDFKTRSALDLDKVGTSVYMEHWSAEVWLACYAIGGGPLCVWRPGHPAPSDLVAHVRTGMPVLAHEAAFERAVWSKVMAMRHGWPEPRLEQWHCIAAMSAAMALPRKLDEAAGVLGLSFEQDLTDKQLLRRLGMPRAIRETRCTLCGADVGEPPASAACQCRQDPRWRTELVWLDDREVIGRVTEYCVRTLETERKLLTKLQPLSAFERQIWLLDQRINERGVSVDLPLARMAHHIVEDRLKALNAQLNSITDGTVGSATQIAKLLAWLRSNGVMFPGGPESNKLGKEEIRFLLQRDLPDKCRCALDIRAEAAKTSTAKLDAFIKRTSADGRLRDSLVYRGAGRTGRWSGKGAQLQNLPRPPAGFTTSAIKSALELIGQGWRIDDIGLLMPAQGLEIITACLRPMLMAAPGHDLIAADYNAIEARGVAWLAGADRMLGIFARGEDPYLDMAAQIYGAPADGFSKTGPERHLGKAAVLGLGYQMGAKTFRETCEKQSVSVTDDLIRRAVEIYREMNPEIRNLWRELEEAATEAVRNEGRPVWCARDRIAFGRQGNWLAMRVPSGRLLWYYRPHLRERAMPWETSGGKPALQVGVSFYGQDEEHKWCRQDGYGGRWVENAVSGLCRDLLANAMLNLEAAGYPIVLSVHDEVVAEVPEEFGSTEEFEDIMCRLPDWASGFPVKAEGWRAKRFQ